MKFPIVLKKLAAIIGVKNPNEVFLFSEFKTLQLIDQAPSQNHTF